MPDLAFNIFSQKNYNLSKNTSICLSFRTDQFPDQLKQIKQFLEKLVEILPTNIELKFYAQVGRDVLNMQELTNHISHIKNKKYDLTISTNDLSDSYSFFQTCGLIISNRLHVLLMGGSRTGHIIACVSSSYNKKVEGIMSMLELDERVVLLDEKESHLIVKPHLQGDTENKIIGLDQHKKLKGVMIKLFETCRNDE
jgi:polysaccharide pyruvyl transferase WcaK-like protein